MTTTANAIVVFFISTIPLINSLVCFTCQTVSNSVVLTNLMDKMFNRASLPTTTSCGYNITAATTTQCPDKCLIAITQSTDDMFAIRGCASAVFTAAQLAALQISTANISSLNNTCFTSQPDSITGEAPALASVCFCDTDSCNSASWTTIMPKVVGKSAATLSLSVVRWTVILIACFIATGNY